MTPGRRLLMLLGTGLGSGYAPVVSGTVGTLAVIPLHALMAWWLPPMAIAVVAVLFVPLAITAAGATARELGSHDPGAVVVDEWAGYLITMAFHPLTLTSVISGFLLFRLFDIVKPFPARRLERLPGGYGIVMDDVAAGLYANAALWLVLAWV